MFNKCFTFFAELTESLVVNGVKSNKFNSLWHIENYNSNSDKLKEHYLYSEEYKINIEKLIPLEQQQKLKAAYGDDWVNVVRGMYKKIERKLHDDTIRKFDGTTVSTNNGGQNE